MPVHRIRFLLFASYTTLAAVFTSPVPVHALPLPTVNAAIEYYHAGFDHWFITAAPDEMEALDAGLITGWSRTGFTRRAGRRPRPPCPT